MNKMWVETARHCRCVSGAYRATLFACGGDDTATVVPDAGSSMDSSTVVDAKSDSTSSSSDAQTYGSVGDRRSGRRHGREQGGRRKDGGDASTVDAGLRPLPSAFQLDSIRTQKSRCSTTTAAR